MRKKCAWCQTDYSCRETDPHLESTNELSHGICDDCAEWLVRNHNQNLSGFLDSFDFPILAVDSDGRISIANDAGTSLLGKSLEEIEGELGGDAMECAHARLPGGCGKTVHCKACTIRRTVTRTHETGESIYGIPAYQEVIQNNNAETINLKISTHKTNELVLLKIEPLL